MKALKGHQVHHWVWFKFTLGTPHFYPDKCTVFRDPFPLLNTRQDNTCSITFLLYIPSSHTKDTKAHRPETTSCWSVAISTVFMGPSSTLSISIKGFEKDPKCLPFTLQRLWKRGAEFIAAGTFKCRKLHPTLSHDQTLHCLHYFQTPLLLIVALNEPGCQSASAKPAGRSAGVIRDLDPHCYFPR